MVIKITTKLDSRFHGNDSNNKHVFAKSAGGERSEDDLVKIKLKQRRISLSRRGELIRDVYKVLPNLFTFLSFNNYL